MVKRIETVKEIRTRITNGKDQWLYAHVDPITGIIIYIGIGVQQRPFDGDRTALEHVEFLYEHAHSAVHILAGPSYKHEMSGIEKRLIAMLNPLFNDKHRTDKEQPGMFTLEALRKMTNLTPVQLEVVEDQVEEEEEVVEKQPSFTEQELAIYEQPVLDYLASADFAMTRAALRRKVNYETVGNCSDVGNAFAGHVIDPMVKKGLLVVVPLPHKRGSLVMISKPNAQA